nr:DUF2381 family protein [Myxococcus sp. RHSTA-1-4]
MVAAVFLLGTAARAQGAKRWRRVERSVSLSAGTGESVQRLRLAPRVVTTVLFDSEVIPEVADPEALRGLFTRVELGTDHLVLKPAVALPDKGVPPLVVRFADADAPRRVVLELTTDAEEVDTVVEVLRHPASAERLEEELAALKAQCAALEARLASARRPVSQEGLAGAILSGAIGRQSVAWKWVDIEPADQGVKALWLDAYRSGEWVALGMELENREGESSWVPGVARLTRLDPEGRETDVVLEVPLHMREARLRPGQRARAVVQWREEGTPAAYSLEVMDTARRQGVRWARVEP